MTSVLRFLLAFVMASAVLLPGLRAHAHGHVTPAVTIDSLAQGNPAIGSAADIAPDIAPGFDGTDAPHGPCEGGAHCDGPFHHHSGCGHVLSYFREIPVWSLIVSGTAAFFEFVPHALPSPDLEGPTQPPRA